MTETTDINKLQKRTDKAIRCLAFFLAKNGTSKDLEKVLLALVEPTRSEKGNISYVLHRSTENPDELVFDEIWEDMASLEMHLKKPYIESLDSKIQHLLAEPVEIKTYTEIKW